MTWYFLSRGLQTNFTFVHFGGVWGHFDQPIGFYPIERRNFSSSFHFSLYRKMDKIVKLLIPNVTEIFLFPLTLSKLREMFEIKFMNSQRRLSLDLYCLWLADLLRFLSIESIPTFCPHFLSQSRSLYTVIFLFLPRNCQYCLAHLGLSRFSNSETATLSIVIWQISTMIFTLSQNKIKPHRFDARLQFDFHLMHVKA